MATNREVVQAWADGKIAQSSNMMTNGYDLYSYKLRIGYTAPNLSASHRLDRNFDDKVVIDYTGKNKWSQTTSGHVNLAKSVSHKEVPRHFSQVPQIGS